MSDEPPMMTLDDYEEALEVELLAVENLENLLDRFVDATTALTGKDYGEHSNLNDPWGNALVALHDLASAPDDKAELVKALKAARDLINDNLSPDISDHLNRRMEDAHRRVLEQVLVALAAVGEGS